jgi:rod shape-determining protein MreC
MLQFFIRNKRIFFLVALLFIALTLFTRDIQGQRPYTLIDKLLLAVFTPPLRLTTQGFLFVSTLWHDYAQLVAAQQDNRRLQEQVKNLAIENQLLQEQARENLRLRELLEFKKRFEFKMIPAEIIGRDPTSWFNTILVDKGSRDGVIKDAGVITPDGVVGRIVAVGFSSAKVLLITDSNSNIDALVKRSRARGIVVGSSEDLCSLSYVLKTEDVATGDMIVSSGQSDMFPRGVHIGSLVAVRKDTSGFFQDIELKPSVDFSRLHEVLIVLKDAL